MKIRMIILTLSMFVLNIFSSCSDNEPQGEIIQEQERAYSNRYYIDPENGEYYNTGHSPSQAWESVDRIMEKTWNAGDTILIKRGTIYNGTLTLRGNGTKDAPIVIMAYGDEGLPIPQINGEGKKDETILLRNVQYWELHNLKITNKGETPRPKSVGIRLVAENIEGGTMNHIYIKNCVIEDIYGTKTHHLNGGGAGIHYYNVVESATPSSFNDIIIENCHFLNCQRDGFIGFLSTGDRTKRKANTNFQVKGNVFEGIPGDQIIITGCEDAVVEHNIIKNCAEGDFSPEGASFPSEAAAAVWCIHSDNVVFRYNIVQDHKATWDGQAFDCDQNCRNILFEYNITYNNVGGFFLVCPLDQDFNHGYAESKGLVVRYNVSINDGTRDYIKENGQRLSSTIDVAGRVVDAHFYNNTIIKTKSAVNNADNRAVTFDNFSNLPSSMKFTNNIFYNTTGVANKFCEATFGQLEDNKGLVLQNNCIYGYTDIPGTDQYNLDNITSNPEFVGLIESFVSNNNLADKDEILEGLKLKSSSSCIGRGQTVADALFPLNLDFWGVGIGSSKNIGAYNH